ncbi:Sedlin [Trichoderma sp. SZMC 28014]
MRYLYVHMYIHISLPAATRAPAPQHHTFSLSLQTTRNTMSAAIPSVACLGVIGRNNNPLHISIFPSYDPTANAFTPVRNPLQFSLLLSSTIDVFDLRSKNSTASGDFGLLHAIDDRLAAYGFETNTGVRMVCIVDMRGRRVEAGGSAGAGGAGGPSQSSASASSSSAAAARASMSNVGAGLRDAELKPVFRAMQSAYVRLLQNPFYHPDEHAPLGGKGGRRITSKKFGDDMKRIGEGWTPGVTAL